MLAGIGGSSIAEAKETLSYSEVRIWQAYMAKRGALNLGLRVEAGSALVAMMINRANGGRAKVEDFMPHFDKAGGAIDLTKASIQDVFRVMSRAAEHTKASQGKSIEIQGERLSDDIDYDYLSGKQNG